jgi:hypothetical protein
MTNAAPPKIPRIAEIIFKAQLIDELQLKALLREREKWGGRITKLMAEMRFADEHAMVAAIAHALKLPAVKLADVPKDPAALSKLNADACEEKGVFPCALKDQGKTLWLAMADPTDYNTVQDLERKHRLRLKLLVAGEQDIRLAVARHYKGITDPNEVLSLGTMAAAKHAMDFDDTPDGNTSGIFLDAKGEVVSKSHHNESNAQATPASMMAEVASAASSVSHDLDHLMGMPRYAFTAEDLERLQAARVNQDRSSKVFRVVLELCVEKGLFSADDVNKLGL